MFTLTMGTLHSQRLAIQVSLKFAKFSHPILTFCAITFSEATSIVKTDKCVALPLMTDVTEAAKQNRPRLLRGKYATLLESLRHLTNISMVDSVSIKVFEIFSHRPWPPSSFYYGSNAVLLLFCYGFNPFLSHFRLFHITLHWNIRILVHLFTLHPMACFLKTFCSIWKPSRIYFSASTFFFTCDWLYETKTDHWVAEARSRYFQYERNRELSILTTRSTKCKNRGGRLGRCTTIRQNSSIIVFHTYITYNDM